MDNKSISVQKQAYKKALLHSCKYPNEDVLGVMTGRVDGKVYTIVDSFPLFHSRVLQAPLEVALDLVASVQTQQIIGVYEARIGGQQSDVSKEILDQIAIHNGKKEGIYLKIVEIQDDDEISSKLIPKFYVGQEQVKTQLDYDIIEEALKQGLHHRIIDLDSHLENVSLDFTNKNLND